MITHKLSPWKIKQAPDPLDGENLKSYGDRLLWHQLGLQMHGYYEFMLTEEEYVAAVRHFYPRAKENNVRLYRSYFNTKHKSMGFRGESSMPIPVEFANSHGLSH
jgi:hypothetical protein